jgi:hypothetical protein
MRHHVTARGGREHPISSFTASWMAFDGASSQSRLRGCRCRCLRLCVLFSLLFLPGHYEFSAPPPPRSPHFRSDLPRALGLCSSCFFLVLPWSLPCSWGHHLGFYLRRYSPTLPKLAGARCWYRSRFSLSLCTSAPPSLLSWYVMTTLFIIFFFPFFLFGSSYFF